MAKVTKWDIEKKNKGDLVKRKSTKNVIKGEVTKWKGQ